MVDLNQMRQLQETLRYNMLSPNSFATVVALRAKSHTFLQGGEVVTVMAPISQFSWIPSSTQSDNGSSVIKPDSLSSTDAGRWVSLFPDVDFIGDLGFYNIEDYGADPTNTALGNANAVQAALDAAHANGPGGKLLVPPKTYAVAMNVITFKDSDVGIVFQPGAKFTTTGAGKLFKGPNGLTQRRYYEFYCGLFTNNNTALGIFMELADSESYVVPKFYGCRGTGWNILFDVTAGDLDYVNDVSIYVSDCKFGPAVGRTDNIPVRTVGNAASFLHGCTLWMHNSFLNDNDVIDAPWTFDCGFEIVASSTAYILLGGTCKMNGVEGPIKLYGYGGFTFYDLTWTGGNYWCFNFAETHISYGTLKFITGPWRIRTSIASGGGIIVGYSDSTIEVDASSTAAVTVDVLAGAHRCVIKGRFTDASTAAIRLTDATYCKIVDCHFASTGTNKTVLEAGSAAANVISACTGLGSGGGYSLVEDNTSYVVEETVFEAYMVRASSTSMRVDRDKGYRVFINGDMMEVTAAGSSRAQSDNLITNTGADAGAAMAVNTIYYAYLSSRNATTFPAQLRFSTTAPTLVRGIYYLGNSGNAKNWRYVGKVRTISNGGTPNFADSLTQRLVANYYNRRDKELFLCPNYQDDDTIDSWTENNHATWTEANLGGGGPGFHVEYLTHGDRAISAWAVIEYFLPDETSDYCQAGLGDNSATNIIAEADGDYIVGKNVSGSVYMYRHFTPADGYRVLYVSVLISGTTGAISLYADNSRQGAPADPPLSWMCARIAA